jgi:hypothetical protein
MEEEKNIGVGSFNIIESLYQPIKDQEKLFGDRKYNFFKENNVDTAELIGIQRDPNAAVVQLNKDDPKNKEINFEYVKDVYNFVADLPDQALYRLVLGGMNATKLGVNLLPAFSRLLGSEPGEDRFDDMYKFSQQADENIKNKITMFKDIYASAFKTEKGRDPNKASDFASYIAQDYPYFAPIYSTLDKIGLPKTISVPLSVGLSSGVAFDPKQQTADGQSESSFFFDSASIKSLKEFFGALPNTPEGEVFDRAYQAFETTGVAAAIGPIINTALFLKRNVPAFNKAIPGTAVATGSATAIGEITDQTILNPQDETMQNQEPTILDNVRSGIDQFGNKLTEIGGAIKKEFSGSAMANPLIKKGVDELAPKLAPVFKSAVVDAVEKIPNKAPGNQILGTIKNIPGVTQTEMKWIGLDDFLKDKPSVTKQELSDFIQANRLDVNEVMLPRTTSTKKTDEELMSWFKDQNGDYGENAYYAYQDIQYALADNGGVRFDDFAFKRGKETQEYRYNTNSFLNDAGLWDEYYENSEALSYNFFKTELQNTFRIKDIISKNKNLDTAGSFEQTMSSFLKEEETFRYYHNTQDLSASEIKNLLFSKDDLAKLKNYLKKDGSKVVTEEIFIDDANLKKLHNEYKIRLNEDDIEQRFEIDFQTIEEFVGGASRTKYERYTLPGGENYKELIFTLSKGGQNVGDNFPLQQGATTKQTTGKVGLDTSPHMNIKGEFAHVRFKERDIAGQKTLTVEELQSDIFQAVKQENKRTIRLAKENTSNAINTDQTARNSFENVTEQELLQKAQSEIDDKTIKDFPFKNNWYELATRRLIRYAADNNFEAIAIPEGRVAAGRYGKVGGFTDNIEIQVLPTYNTTGLDAAQRKNLDAIPAVYEFYVSYNKGAKQIKKDIFIGEEIYKLKDQFPKSFEQFNGDLKDILLNKYTPDELKKNPFNYRLSEKQFVGEGKGKFELYDQAIPAYMKKYAKKWNAPITTEQVKFREQNETINYTVLKITPEMKRSVQDKSQPLFNIVLPALSAGGGAKVISDNMENNTISNPTKN